MEKDYYQRIKDQYENSRGNTTGLFEIILAAGKEIGLESALEYLERCVIEKRTAWLERNIDAFDKTGNALLDGYKLFYEQYLGLSIPEDGEMVEVTAQRITVRWHNPCPTLDACQKLGLDTQVICRLAYEKPVQVMLSRLDPRLKFIRNYAALRPAEAYCEESIELIDEFL